MLKICISASNLSINRSYIQYPVIVVLGYSRKIEVNPKEDKHNPLKKTNVFNNIFFNSQTLSLQNGNSKKESQESEYYHFMQRKLLKT